MKDGVLVKYFAERVLVYVERVSFGFCIQGWKQGFFVGFWSNEHVLLQQGCSTCFSESVLLKHVVFLFRLLVCCLVACG